MKSYQVKVYNANETYITTWKDTDKVSDINFSNEINTAGGQLSVTLGRDAGDYGEGSDIDFGHRVKVYVFDNEAPSGLLIFQGYISAYTPIYKDNKVEVTILGYGAELNDYVLEAGESEFIANAETNGYAVFGNWASPSSTQGFAQTFTAPESGRVSRVVLKLKTLLAYTNVPVVVTLNSGTPGSESLLATSNTVTVVNTTAQTCSFTFSESVNFNTDDEFFVYITTAVPYYPGTDKYPVGVLSSAISPAGGYADGGVWVYYNV